MGGRFRPRTVTAPATALTVQSKVIATRLDREGRFTNSVDSGE